MKRCLLAVATVVLAGVAVAIADDPKPAIPTQPGVQAKAALPLQPGAQPKAVQPGPAVRIAPVTATRLAALEEELETLEAHRDVRKAHVKAAEVAVKAAELGVARVRDAAARGIVSK